jgi:hypothetical protein
MVDRYVVEEERMDMRSAELIAPLLVQERLDWIARRQLAAAIIRQDDTYKNRRRLRFRQFSAKWHPGVQPLLEAS